MAATAIRNRPAAAEETPQALSDKVSQQVSDILDEAQRQEQARQETRPAIAYRVPAPGVRYYF